MIRRLMSALALAALVTLAPALVSAAPDLPPDETALRHYAAQGQRDRVEAEIRRMKLVHRGWQPPADLWTARPGGPDEAPLWRLFAADRLDELDRELARRRAADPAWQPSADLAAKIARKRLRHAVLAAGATGRWEQAAQAGAGASVGADDIELAWVLAEARARAGLPDEASGVYRALLAADLPPDQHRATLLKSAAVLPFARVQALAASAEAAGVDLAPVRLDLTRAQIGAILKGEAVGPPAAADLAAVEAAARAANDGPSLALVAWYALRHQQAADAGVLFRQSLQARPDALVAHGLAQALLAAGRRAEAAATALTWSEGLANNAIMALDLAAEDVSAAQGGTADPAVLRRLATMTLALASGEGAQALGWYAYSACDAAAALPWFERAVAWHPREGSVLGLALTLQRLGRRREAADLANRYDGLFPRVVEVVMVRGGATADPCRPESSLAAAAGTARRAGSGIPLPDASVPSGRGGVFVRGEFPRPVASENPWRFAAGPGGDGGRVATGTPAALPTRRVAGAPPMPYGAVEPAAPSALRVSGMRAAVPSPTDRP